MKTNRLSPRAWTTTTNLAILFSTIISTCGITSWNTAPTATTSWTLTPRVTTTTEIGNLVICNWKLIETITLPITIGNWHYSRIIVIGNVVDSIAETRKKQLLFIMTYKRYKFIHNTKSNLVLRRRCVL